MSAKSEIAAAVRPLGGTGRPLPGTKGMFQGVIEQIHGRRLVIRTPNADAIACGTLVEVDTAERVYLGEIKHVWEGTVFIDFEHELTKSALATIRKVWF